jgi:hypothetical protein
MSRDFIRGLSVGLLISAALWIGVIYLVKWWIG